MTQGTHPPFGLSLGFLLADAARLLRRRFEQNCRDLDMTSAQMRIIARLARSEGISQATLAAMVDLEPMTLCRHIDRMESGGLVVREQNPDDRRARQLFTTAKARELIEPMRGRAEELFAQAQEGLPPESRELLIEALTVIVKNLSDLETTGTASEPDVARSKKIAETLEKSA